MPLHAADSDDSGGRGGVWPVGARGRAPFRTRRPPREGGEGGRGGAGGGRRGDEASTAARVSGSGRCRAPAAGGYGRRSGAGTRGRGLPRGSESWPPSQCRGRRASDFTQTISLNIYPCASRLQRQPIYLNIYPSIYPRKERLFRAVAALLRFRRARAADRRRPSLDSDLDPSRLGLDSDLELLDSGRVSFGVTDSSPETAFAAALQRPCRSAPEPGWRFRRSKTRSGTCTTRMPPPLCK